MTSSSRRLLWLSLYGALAAFLIAGFLDRYPLPDGLSKIKAVLECFFIFAGTYGAGLFIARKILRLEIPLPWLFIFSVALGLGALSVSVLFIGWIAPGPLQPKLGALTLLGGVFALYGLRQTALSKIKLNSFSMPFFNVVCFALTGLGALTCFLSAFSPITYYDSLVYHLALPSYYLAQGRIMAVPFNLYSYFPANTEMLYLYILGRFAEPESVINLTLFGLSALISVGVYLWGKENADAKTAWLSVALWWTMPAVLLLSVGGYVEIPLAFYSFLSLRAFHMSRTQGNDNRWMAVSGLLSGFASATKYTGAITPILLFCLLAWLFLRKQISGKTLLIFCWAALLPILPWFLRNALWIKNPFFPFFYRFFGGDVGWTHESAGAYFQMLTEYGAKSSVFFELLAAPFEMLLNAAKFGGGFDVVGDFGWPLFILAAPLGLAVLWKPGKNRWLGIYFVLHFCLWFLTKPVLRFLVGVLPIAVFIGALGIRKVLLDKKGMVSFLAYFFTGLLLISNFFILAEAYFAFKPFEVPLGFTEREPYLRRRLAFYGTFDHINRILTAPNRIFIIGEQRNYHLHVPYVSASIFAPSPIARFCDEPGGLERAFEEQGISHILIHIGEIERLGGLEKFGFSEEGKKVFAQYLKKNCRLIFNQNGLFLYERMSSKTN